MRHCLWIFVLLGVALNSEMTHAETPVVDAAQVTIIGSPALLPLGEKCRVELKPEAGNRVQTVTYYSGTIQKSTAKTLTLVNADRESRCTIQHPLATVPFLSRYFKTTGIAKEPVHEKELRIPIEQIRMVTVAHEKS